MKKIAKTNVARLLDQAKISYSLVPYIVDENDLSAGHIAEQLGEDIEQVFKTLVLRGDKTGHFVCGLEESRKNFGQQESRLDSDEGIAAHHGLYSWWLFANRHEKAFPYLFPRNLHFVRLHLCECWRAWFATENQSRRPCEICGRNCVRLGFG